MDDQQQTFCPNCGKVIVNKNRSYCISCGFMFSSNVAVQTEVGIDNQSKKKRPRGLLKRLILSIINLFTIVLYLVVSLGSYKFASSIVGLPTHYSIFAYLAFGYIFASVIASCLFFIDFILRGKIYSFVKKIIIICFLLGAIVPFGLKSLNISFDTISFKKNNIEKNVVAFDDDFFTIKQIDMIYSQKTIDLVLDMNFKQNISLDYTDINPKYVLVNHCLVRGTFSHNSNDPDNRYHVYISLSDIKKYKINDIYKIDIGLSFPYIYEINYQTISFSIPTNSKNNRDSQLAIIIKDYPLLYSSTYFDLYGKVNNSKREFAEMFIVYKSTEHYYGEFNLYVDDHRTNYFHTDLSDEHLYEGSIIYRYISVSPLYKDKKIDYYTLDYEIKTGSNYKNESILDKNSVIIKFE